AAEADGAVSAAAPRRVWAAYRPKKASRSWGAESWGADPVVALQMIVQGLTIARRRQQRRQAQVVFIGRRRPLQARSSQQVAGVDHRGGRRLALAEADLLHAQVFARGLQTAVHAQELPPGQLDLIIGARDHQPGVVAGLALHL